MIWKDQVYERIPTANLPCRITWHATRIFDQGPKPAHLTFRQMGDAAYGRALRIVQSEDAGQGMPLDEVWE